MEQRKVRPGSHRVFQSARQARQSWSTQGSARPSPSWGTSRRGGNGGPRGGRGFRSRESAQTWPCRPRTPRTARFGSARPTPSSSSPERAAHRPSSGSAPLWPTHAGNLPVADKTVSPAPHRRPLCRLTEPLLSEPDDPLTSASGGRSSGRASQASRYLGPGVGRVPSASGAGATPAAR